MKKIFVIGLALFTASMAQADALGIYRCNSKDQIGRKALVSIDLDSNEIFYLEDGSDPQDPAQWKPIFSASIPTFCGYAPANPQGIECGFTTNHRPETGYTSKSLLCQKRYENGSASTIITGNLYLNTKSLSGTLLCSIRGNVGKNLVLSSCQQQ